jgi:soluble lytic murein transglycosylase-like protein
MNVELGRRRLLIGLGCLATGHASMARPSRAPAAIPPAYSMAAREAGVPPAVLYGVALQESSFLFNHAGGRHALPWPWTLNVAGRPARLATRPQAEERLHAVLRSGIRNVDVGPMQINWRYHQDRLGSVRRALDPYWNLRVGAELLAMHYAASREWPVAVGRYHAPSDSRRAARYASQVFDRLRRIGHA